MRLVIDLSMLNEWLACPNFKIDHAQVVRRTCTERVGVFHRLVRRLFTYPDTRSVLKVFCVLGGQPPLPVHGATIRAEHSATRIFRGYECHQTLTPAKLVSSFFGIPDVALVAKMLETGTAGQPGKVRDVSFARDCLPRRPARLQQRVHLSNAGALRVDLRQDTQGHTSQGGVSKTVLPFGGFHARSLQLLIN